MKVEQLSQPVMGWNSFDAYSIYINEEQALRNLDAFLTRLKPHGYEYFCIDSGWYAEYAFMLDPDCEDATRVHFCLDEYGRFTPSLRLFPRGLKYLADRCHENGIKFGLHLMRGIPRLAVERNTPVFGTPYHAADIADTTDVCPWCDYTYGVDMTRPGAQEYYNSVLNYLCDEIGIDLIKADDLCDFPLEIEAIGKAIAQASRPVVFSLSPGDLVWKGNWEVLRKYCNMIRVSCDIWDTQTALFTTFERWEMWEEFGSRSCCLDLDMIPFGKLLVNQKGEAADGNAALAGLDHARFSRFSLFDKQVFITQRALAASPLIFGGDLVESPQEDLDLVTHLEVLACCRNFQVGRKIYCRKELDIRRTEESGRPGAGWLGIFNRRRHLPRQHAFTSSDLGFETWPGRLYSVWEDQCLQPDEHGLLRLTVPPAHSVFFIRFEDSPAK